jgi:heptosyltransferase-2
MSQVEGSGRLQTALVNTLCGIGWRLLAPLRRRRLTQLQAGTPIRSILVFNPVSGIGNMILLSGLLVNLRRRFPEASIAVTMPPSPLAPTLLDASLADELLQYHEVSPSAAGLLRFAWDVLRPRRFELGLGTFFSATLRTAAFLAVAGCRYRVAFAQSPQRGFLNTLTLIDAPGHELDRHLRLLSFAGGLHERRTVVHVPAPLREAASRYLTQRQLGTQRPLVGIHPGCDRVNLLKRWPAQRFRELIEQLVNETGADVLVFFGPDDTDLLPVFEPLAGARVHLVADAPFERVAALVHECHAFVSNDSGLMHTAAAMDVPVVGLFGPTDTRKNAPVGSAIVLTASDVPCRPCHRQSPITCDQPRQWCLEHISVARVLAEVHHLLARRATVRRHWTQIDPHVA